MTRTRFKKFAAPLLALAGSAALAACGAPADDANVEADRASVAEEPGTIVAVAQGDEAFSTLVTALTAAGLVQTLSGDGSFTVFAPTDTAFGKLPEGTLQELTEAEDKEPLKAILTYHVVDGAADITTLKNNIETNEGSYEIPTLNGGNLTATLEGGNVVLTDATGNSATIMATDIEASNGMIHVIDGVLMPG